MKTFTKSLLAFALALGTHWAFCGEKVWTGGGGDALASNGDNWAPAGAPATGDAVVLNSGDAAMTWDAGMKDVVPASWTQDGYTGTVTFETVFDTEGFAYAEISGNVVINTGTWTHLGNTSACVNRLYVKCGGDFTLGPDATISAIGLGYGPKLVSVHGLPWQTKTQGGSYGGHGSLAVATADFTYGCYYAPEDLGNAGYWAGNDLVLSGGGAIRLDVGGHLTQNGLVTADSAPKNAGNNYSGAGGSIYITAGSVSGSGRMTADSSATKFPGAGGRIAIILTGRTGDVANGFDDYDVVSLVEAVPTMKATTQGGPGTIYCETADDKPHEGWMILKGNGQDPTDNKLYYADPFTADCTSLHFAKLTVTGTTLLRIGAGCTLDLEGTEIDAAADSGFAIDGGTLTFGEGKDWEISYRVRYFDEGTIPPICSIAAGGALYNHSDKTWNQGLEIYGTYVCNGADVFNGNIHVYSGGTITQEGAPAIDKASEKKVDLTVTGNMTIDEGGSVCVDGCGYAATKSPYGNIPNGWGGTYGGFCFNTGGSENINQPPYGSIKNPTDPGCGGSNASLGTPGGGAFLLTVAGRLTVNGRITSDSATSTYYPGSGGTINITAGTISGQSAAVISANAGGATNGGTQSNGSGGRIAIRLTGEDADFSQYAGTITAYGTTNGSNKPCGGAGTIFLRTAAQDEDEGTLIVSNGPDTARVTGCRTPLAVNASNPDLAFGDVIIGPKAILSLGEGEVLTVKGSFTNDGTFQAGAGSMVEFAGGDDAVISGDTVFDTFKCVALGKRLTVADGTVITATALATVEGSDEGPVTMTAASAEGTWTLDASAGAASFANVNIGGCQSVASLTVQGGSDLGNNSANVKVITAQATTLTWTGAVNGNWSEAGNWSAAEGDARAPMAADTVIIAAAANQPTILADASCAALTVSANASLNLADKNLTVAHDLSVAGALAASGSQTISVGGDLSISGTFACGRSVIALTGSAVQEVTATPALFGLDVRGAGADILTPLTCSKFTAGGVSQTIRFASGVLLKTSVFTVNGDLASAPVSLGPIADGGAWSLLAYANDVTGVKVANCDASAGLPIVPAASQDKGGNVNWLFTDTRTLWDGTTALEDGMDVVLVADATAAITEDVALNSLELRTGSSLTISAAVPVTKDVLVGSDATLSWNRPATIGGRLVVLEGAKLTHEANDIQELNKIDLAVDGDGYFAERCEVDASSRGYGPNRGPGCGGRGDVFTSASSHGGWGYEGIYATKPCYGSICCPTNCGSGSNQGGETTSHGGGAIILKFGGALTMDGSMSADAEAGGQYYSASGGSINLTAASIAGKGTLRAYGGTVTTDSAGGGGRIAITLTGANSDFASFTGFVEAFGGFCGSWARGSAGTVYLKTAADNGRLEVRNSKYTNRNDAKDFTDFPSEVLCDPDECRMVDLVVSDYGSLSLTRDMEVSSLTFLGTNPRVLLNGHTLRVHSYNPYKKGYPAGVTVVEDGGAIVWDKPGLMIMVR